MDDRILSRQFHAAKGAEDWRVLPDGAYAFFRTNSFATSVRFVDAITGLIGAADAPDFDIRSDGVTVRLRAFKGVDYGLFPPDLELARAISSAAREMSLTAEPSAIHDLLIIPGAKVRSEIMPFWQAVLGYQPRPDSPDEDLVDPHGRSAPFWFEEMRQLRADGGGTMHLSVWVPWDEAESRLAAALAAGGRVVRHNEAENYWTLADPAGNEVDISSTLPPEPAE